LMTSGGDCFRDLDDWLAPFLDVMGRKTRRSWAPFYVRGLLGPGERKSLQPMAARLGLPGHDQLQHFIASTAWDDAPLWTVLAHEADRLGGEAEFRLTIISHPFQSFDRSSVSGLARQHAEIDADLFSQFRTPSLARVAHGAGVVADAQRHGDRSPGPGKVEAFHFRGERVPAVTQRRQDDLHVVAIEDALHGDLLRFT